jgi:cardiolipin synthase C
MESHIARIRSFIHANISLGGRSTLVRLFAIAGVLAIQSCASLSELPKKPSQAIPASAQDDLSKLVSPDLHRNGESAFRPLAFSDYAMDARLTLARRAQRSLDIQYYLLSDDSTGRAFLRAVRDASVRGVRVRLLLDDLYTASNDRLLQGLAAYPNVEVRLFNPFPAGRASNVTRWGASLLDLARLNHRMHNKLFVADGVFAVVGGRNIADEYFFRSERGNFIDLDLLVAGDAVADLSKTFDAYWNSPRVYTLDALESAAREAPTRRADFEQLTFQDDTIFPTYSDGARDLLNFRPLSIDVLTPPLKMLSGRIQVFADNPEKVSGRSERGDDKTTVASQVIESIVSSKEDVLLVSPYFIPGSAAMARMKRIRDDGVSITLVTNTMAANDEPFVSYAYARYRKRLLQMGVQIYEVSPRILSNTAGFPDTFGSSLGTSTGRLHAKVIVLDHHITFVGSMNLDFRSARENTELGLLVDSPELAADVADLAAELRSKGTYRMRLSKPEGKVEWVDSEEGRDQVFQSEPEVNLWKELEVLLFSPFINEDLL